VRPTSKDRAVCASPVGERLAPRLGILILLGVATCFAAIHLAARFAFAHGASVAAGVTVRATSTALVLLAMMRLQGLAITVPRALRGKALLAGVLIATQSYCLYSAVALIPPALALLVFQTSPMLYVLLTWAMGKEKPRLSALAPMLLALAGLALALGLASGQLAARWGEIGAGVLWAFASGASMSVVYFLNDDFAGGELVFPELDLIVKPEAGTLVCFPSDHNYVHGVNPVTSGHRYTVVTWMRVKGMPTKEEINRMAMDEYHRLWPQQIAQPPRLTRGGGIS
jgi:hypothetical protein